MENNRIIKVRNRQLKKIRDILRQVIWLAVNRKIEDLIDNQFEVLSNHYLSKTEKNRNIKSINDRIPEFKYSFEKSICICPSCSSRTKDLGFNLIRLTWYCIDCLNQITRKVDINKYF